MVKNYEKLGCLMNLKLHFLDSHLDFLSENLGDCSEEQGERFYQEIKEMERRYQGKGDINMMPDYIAEQSKETCHQINKKNKSADKRV